MRVVKRGNVDKLDPWMHGTCIKCGCEIECKRSEGKWMQDRPWDGCLIATCPTQGCGEGIYLEEGKSRSASTWDYEGR